MDVSVEYDLTITAARSRPVWLKRFQQHFQRNGVYYLMCLPGVLLVFVFAYMPMPGIVIAFKDFKYDQGIWASAWVGFENFRYLFATSKIWEVIANTVFMNLLFLSVGTITSLALALLLNEVQGKIQARFYQSALFFPNFLSWVIVSYFAFAFLSADNGILNQMLEAAGMRPISWYSRPEYWPAILLISNLWRSVGFGSLIYLSGILGISQEIYEAAYIDGASKWRSHWHITLPLLAPQIVFMTLISMGYILSSDFGLFFFVPRDNPALYSTTDVLATYVFRALRQGTYLGQSSAVGLFQSTVGFFLVVIANLIVRRVQPDRQLY